MVSHVYTCTGARSLQLCSTLCNPIDCSLPGSSVHGTFQARVLEWVVIPSSRRSSQPRGLNPCLLHLLHSGGFFTSTATWEAPYKCILIFKALQVTHIKYIQVFVCQSCLNEGFFLKAFVKINECEGWEGNEEIKEKLSYREKATSTPRFSLPTIENYFNIHGIITEAP